MSRELPHDQQLLERLGRHLARVDDVPPAGGADVGGRGHAAVAIVLHPDGVGASQLFVIRRASHLSTHAGQFGLPGGSLDPGEGPATAARRELAEELDVHLGVADVVGRLGTYVTTSGFSIHPVVLWAGAELSVVPDPREVAYVHRASLGQLQTGVDRLQAAGGSGQAVESVPMLGTTVHAPTGEILRRMVVVGLHGGDPGPGLPEPRFAWR